MVCVHEAYVLCVLGPFHKLPFGTERKPLSKEQQYSEQSTSSEDYDSSNKLRDVFSTEVAHVTSIGPNDSMLKLWTAMQQ